MQQTPEEYHEELLAEVEKLKKKQEIYPTEYKERRIKELSKRLGISDDSAG